MSHHPIRLFLAILAIFLLVGAVQAQTISDESRRYMNRGQEAMGMAKSQADYQEAVQEFDKAVKAAPKWPAAHYNLGIAQEKAGKLQESVRSLKTYLLLSPDAKDREQVLSFIDRSEYRLERSGKENARIVPLLGTWDRFIPETGEKLDAYTFTAKDGKITVSLPGAFGPIISPVEIDGKNVSFKYIHNTFNVDTEYEISAQLISPTIMRGNMKNQIKRSNIKFLQVGNRGMVSAEFRKRNH